jgi:hypothetical protein
MQLGRTEAKFFGIANLPLVEIPHHPSGGAREGEHRADAEGAVELVREKLTLGAPHQVNYAPKRERKI